MVIILTTFIYILTWLNEMLWIILGAGHGKVWRKKKGVIAAAATVMVGLMLRWYRG